MQQELKLPVYAKTTIYLVGIFVLLALLYAARGIIIPLIFAILIAIMLHPIVNFFVRKKFNRVVAIVISLFLTIVLFASIVALLFTQAIRFGESWPILLDKFTGVLNNTSSWVSGYFNINPQKIHEWIEKTKGDIINFSSVAIGKTLITVGHGVVILIIVPIYTIMILYYQNLLVEFIRKFFGKPNLGRVNEIITQVKTVVQHYLKGLITEFVIVATLYCSSLLILGIDYAIFLGIFGALINVIPYLGGIIAASLSIMVALATKSSAWYALYVLACYYLVHLIDYNFIIPKIVASKVKINALVSIIGIIAAYAMFGIPGMIICIPIMGIVKLIFDHIEPLKPWGYLLGDTMPAKEKVRPARVSGRKKTK